MFTVCWENQAFVTYTAHRHVSRFTRSILNTGNVYSVLRKPSFCYLHCTQACQQIYQLHFEHRKCLQCAEKTKLLLLTLHTGMSADLPAPFWTQEMFTVCWENQAFVTYTAHRHVSRFTSSILNIGNVYSVLRKPSFCYLHCTQACQQIYPLHFEHRKCLQCAEKTKLLLLTLHTGMSADLPAPFWTQEMFTVCWENQAFVTYTAHRHVSRFTSSILNIGNVYSVLRKPSFCYLHCTQACQQIYPLHFEHRKCLQCAEKTKLLLLTLHTGMSADLPAPFLT